MYSIKLAMEKITFSLERYKQLKKAPAHYWQQLALDALEYLDNPTKSQVFKWAKTREGTLKAALDYMRQREITDFRYLCAMMNK